MHQATPRQRSFFGMPVGLAYLSFTEMWERFSFYGMSSILVLYMTQALLLPGRVEGVAGFVRFRGALEGVFGPLSTLALASQIFGIYAGLMYFTPVFGGLIADRWIGKRAAVMAGALLLSAGHVAMAFDASFLLALALLILGGGLLKGNISAQVGTLFPEAASEARTQAFAVYSTAINIGAVMGPLVCGLLAQIYGWHVGFAASGALMLFGLATYVAGFRHLPEPVRARARAAAPPLTGAEWRTLALLVVVLVLSIFQTVIYVQGTNIGLVWIDAYVDRHIGSFTMPAAWFVSVDALSSIVFMVPLLMLWRWQARDGDGPSEIGKIWTGVVIATLASGLMVVASTGAIPGSVSLFYPMLSLVLFGVAFIYYWPPMLTLVSRMAPAKVNSTMMGVVFLNLFVGNLLAGWIGGFYEPLGPNGFWWLQVVIGAVGVVVIAVLKAPLERALGAR